MIAFAALFTFGITNNAESQSYARSAEDSIGQAYLAMEQEALFSFLDQLPDFLDVSILLSTNCLIVKDSIQFIVDDPEFGTDTIWSWKTIRGLASHRIDHDCDTCTYVMFVDDTLLGTTHLDPSYIFKSRFQDSLTWLYRDLQSIPLPFREYPSGKMMYVSSLDVGNFQGEYARYGNHYANGIILTRVVFDTQYTYGLIGTVYGWSEQGSFLIKRESGNWVIKDYNISGYF